MVFITVTPCGLTEEDQRVGETRYTLKMEAAVLYTKEHGVTPQMDLIMIF